MKFLPSQNIVAFYEGPFDPKRLVRDLRRTRQTVGGKPRGLWYACGDAWLRWYDEDNLREWDGKIPPFTYEFDLDKSRFLLIHDAHGMRRFRDTYGVTDDDLDPGWVDIDWRVVAKEYDGIQICPAQSKKGMGWYYGWDVASGCVWRKRAVLGFRRIT